MTIVRTCIVVVLCSYVSCCTDHTDTRTAKEWPRLSASARHCRDESCDATVSTEAQAVCRLVLHPECTDQAVTALESFSASSSAAMSDLAAAYYLRAQRNHEPADLLRALDAADRALQSIPRPREAMFNRALILEQLGLRQDALAAWDAQAGDDEARRRGDALRRELAAEPHWSAARLDAALRAGNAMPIVRRYPTSALHHLEEQLLTPDRLADAQTLADLLWRVTGDRYARDVVASAHGAMFARGYAAFRAGRKGRNVGAPDWRNQLAAASAELRKAGSPLYLAADVALQSAPEATEREVRRRGYTSLLTKILATRGFLDLEDSRFLDSLKAYDEALALCSRDPENAATIRPRRLGVLRVMGDNNAAWREALQAFRNIAQIGAVRDRTDLIGETAESALALGHPAAALLYVGEAVRLLRSDFAASGNDVQLLKYNLSIARRWQASYELHLGDYAGARRDLDHAIELLPKSSDDAFRRSLQTRIAEVKAQALLGTNPRAAADAFQLAIGLSRGLSYRTYRASLYAQRAHALRNAHEPEAAERDLRAALDELHAEEEDLMARRQPGHDDDVWDLYFARFQPAYHELIRQLIEEGKAEEAFVYADRARAFEQLSLAVAPQPPTPIGIAQLQRLLPRGTYAIEYAALDDRAYAWIIARDQWQIVKLDVPAAKIRGWTASIPNDDETFFEGTLLAAYAGLMAEPMTRIHAASPRLVIIPDGAISGLPFAALKNPVTRRYLVQDATISIAPSAALYAVSRRRNALLRDDDSALLIGNPAAEGVARLPGAQQEVEQIAALYPHAVVRIGEHATPDELIAQARHSAIIHVAAHATLDARAPSHSSLLLSPSARDTGAIDAAQLLLRLKKLERTRLVVLSACSSGVGPLVRPLIAAGVPAVVGSLWDVRDATAEELLVSFHRHYRDGDDAAAALQAAQLRMLTGNPGLRQVRAWAPFEVIGDAPSPFAAARH
jgi:CHAT domain-containing protein